MLGSVNLTKSGTLYVIIIIILVIAGAMNLGGGIFPTEQEPPAGAQPVIINTHGLTGNNPNGQGALQLRTLTYITPTPTMVYVPPAPPKTISVNGQPPQPNSTSTGTSQSSGSQNVPKECSAAECSSVDANRNSTCGSSRPADCYQADAYKHQDCNTYASCISTFAQNEHSTYGCVCKPVIYLYPTRTTKVHVKLRIPGIITTSIPTYPKSGWNVVAHPGGELTYSGKQYNELFYESAVAVPTPSLSGIVIPTSDLREKLLLYTHQLGLLPSEQQEFVSYWVPKLLDLHSPYIQFSVLTPAEKDRIDNVTISPKPQTQIQFLVYFKPLETNIVPLKPLLLPEYPPKRVGFTAVEWGGTIGD